MDLAGSRCVKLCDGHQMPVLGLGTYATPDVPKSQACEATKVAIEVGYRHIDAAYMYQNEEEVGAAMRAKMADGTVRREDLFYTTKIWSTFFRPELVRQGLAQSLEKLGLDYVDLLLIHIPIPLQPGKEVLPMDASGKLILDTVDLCQTWEALERCKDAGLTKSIGVSNFNRKLLEMILNKPGLKYKPVCNQVECHPYLNQHKLLDFCRSKDIVLVAYSALGSHRDSRWIPQDSPYLLEDPVLNAIAKEHNRTPGQVALRYQLQRGVVVLAKSFSEKRIKENFQVFDFELTPEDMKAIDSLNRNFRYFNMDLDWGACAWSCRSTGACAMSRTYQEKSPIIETAWGLGRVPKSQAGEATKVAIEVDSSTLILPTAMKMRGRCMQRMACSTTKHSKVLTTVPGASLTTWRVAPLQSWFEGFFPPTRSSPLERKEQAWVLPLMVSL